ncbi:restriction endonuclease subunit S [Tenacibaculum dicentrarchi]|nr:restriction endonuclease subunit S [Tenacibaculum dicentrarchi]
MRLNYKRLGDYIQTVNIRNKNLEVETLLGVSIRKVLMPSIANTIGTDMSRYKIINKNQFAYSSVTSRNGDKISIALLENHDKALVSQAYTVFEIIDDEELNAEYLMMWFRRPEFDRYARFKSHGSARETFDWEELQDTELPIPSIEKQHEIVKEYNTVANRITLNETINKKLEDTAQALYKHWFVDFEFPNEQGKPYKSNGGKMVYNEELDLEIPLGWSDEQLSKVIRFKNGKKKPKIKGIYSVYGGNGIIDFVNDFNFESTIIVGRVGAYCGSLYIEYGKCWVSDNAISGYSINNELTYCLYLLKDLKISEKREGTGQPLITQSLLNEILFINPPKTLKNTFNLKVEIIQNYIKINIIEIKKLKKINNLLLSKMSKVAIEKEMVC